MTNTVVTVKSSVITNQDASPRIAPQAGVGGAYRVDEIDSTVAVAATDAATSTYLAFRVPSTIRVKDLWLESAALGGSCAVNVGVAYADRKEDCAVGIVPGTVISAAFFASAVVVSSAVAATNITNESGTYTTALRSEPLWQALGLSVDPGGKFDIVAALTVDAATAGNLYLKMGFAE